MLIVEDRMSEVHLQNHSRRTVNLCVHRAFKSPPFGSNHHPETHTHTAASESQPIPQRTHDNGRGVSDSAFWALLFQMTQTTPSHQQRTSDTRR